MQSDASPPHNPPWLPLPRRGACSREQRVQAFGLCDGVEVGNVDVRRLDAKHGDNVAPLAIRRLSAESVPIELLKHDVLCREDRERANAGQDVEEAAPLELSRPQAS